MDADSDPASAPHKEGTSFSKQALGSCNGGNDAGDFTFYSFNIYTGRTADRPDGPSDFLFWLFDRRSRAVFAADDSGEKMVYKKIS